jgi:hypothetical protein
MNSDRISAYSFIQDGDAIGSGALYAESGYFRFRNQSSWYIFAEFSTNGTECRTETSSPCLDETMTTTSNADNIQYYQIYSTSSDEMEMWYYDGTTRGKILTTNYDPTASGTNHWSDYWQHVYSGHTHNVQNDVPGSVDHKASFTSIAYAPSSWDGTGTPSFTDLGTTPSSNNMDSVSYYCFENGGTDSSFNIWVNGSCPS